MGASRRGPDGLTDLERDICHAVDRGLTDIAAYRAVRPQAKASDLTAERYVWRIRHRPQCVAYIRKLQAAARDRHAQEKDAIVRELVNLSRSDMGAFTDWGPDGAALRDVRELTPEQRRQVSKLFFTKTRYGGSLRIELYDKLSAFRTLCRVLGYYDTAERKDGDEPSPSEIVAQMSDVEKAQRLAAILRQGKQGYESKESSERGEADQETGLS